MAVYEVNGLHEAPVTNVVDPGTYHVSILGMEVGTSKEKGTPFYKFTFSILGGPIQQSSGREPIGRHIINTIYIPVSGEGTLIGLGKLKRLCKAVGYEVPENNLVDDEYLIGRELLINVKHREYQGEPQEEVTSYKAVG